jgi:hypothetical protein
LDRLIMGLYPLIITGKVRMNFGVLRIKSDRAAIGLFGLCTLPHGGKGCTQNIMDHSNIWMLLR